MAPMCTNGSQDTPGLGRFHCARCSHDLCEKCYVASLSQERSATPAAREAALVQPRHAAREGPGVSCAHRDAASRPRPPSPPAYARPSRPGGLAKTRLTRRRPAAARAADPPAAMPLGAGGGGARAPPHTSLLQREAERGLQARLLQRYQGKLGAQEMRDTSGSSQVSACSTAAPLSLPTTARSPSRPEEGNEILRLPQLPSPRASQAAAPDVGGAASQRWWMPSTEQPRTPRLAERAPRLE
ncbi:unnamed protein product, partial [Prorocentrum cordatum]